MQIDFSTLSLSLGAGIVAFLNPCGFVLLPSYVTHYLGSHDGSRQERWWDRGWRGLSVGLSVSAGFFTVFVIIGALIAILGTAVGQYLSWAAVAVGAGIIVLGLGTLLGHSLELPLNKLTTRFTSGRGSAMIFYYLYGIGYALASSGCTLPIFLIYVISPALTGGLLSGFLSFLAYASGMTVMMLLLSLGLAFSKSGIDRDLPIRWALIGLGFPLMALVAIAWSQPGISANWLAAFSGENQLLLSVLAPALILMLLFQLWRWERAARWFSGAILMLAGSYLIYYQLKSGLLA